MTPMTLKAARPAPKRMTSFSNQSALHPLTSKSTSVPVVMVTAKKKMMLNQDIDNLKRFFKPFYPC